MEKISIFLSSVTIFIVVIGWFVNQWLSRRNEIRKEARNYRLDMLRSFMDLVSYIEEKNNLKGIPTPNEYGDFDHDIPETPEWATMDIKIKMYGNNVEIELYKDIMSEIYAILYDDDGCLTDKRFRKLYDKIKKLENICVNSIREELKLDKISLKKVSDYDE
ncbi:MAG: hypothetical protein FWD60_07045 [Candidatus Azobacteroides sp.]|nr:hypothetical protein [Candidatus Azobacteroides sp.]